MAMKIRNDDLRKIFKSFSIWEHKPASETVTSDRKPKSDTHVKADKSRIIDDKLDNKSIDRTSQEMLEVDQIKPLSNPSDPYDDFNVFWNPEELFDATKALATYNVKHLYKKNPYTVKKTLHLIFLIMKYKPLLKDLLQIGEYFQRFPEDVNDENIVFIALFDILCRGDGITLENEMDAYLRREYKNIGLKVVYTQVEKDKLHYFEQVYERLNDIGAASVHDLLPTTVPMQINIKFPIIFDIWINKSNFNNWPEELLEEAGFKRVGTRTSCGLTYNEIVDLPYFFELGVSNYSEFLKTSHYSNHVFIPTDRNHCLAMAKLVKQLYKGGITKGTVIQTHILSLSATAYFAYLLNIGFPSTMKLKVFGADRMKASFESYFEMLNLKNVKVFSERFYIVNCRKKDIASTTCVLVNPETVFNPSMNIIDETMSRGCDLVYLESAYELFSENDIHDYSFVNQYSYDLKELARCNIRRALSIPKVKFIVYQSFDTRETANDNAGLYVVNFARECSHTSIVPIKKDMSTTEIEDANYKYCKMLNLYFRQGNTPNNIVSPALWGSKPPFITTIYRVDPVICDTETEVEKNKENDKYRTSKKRSSTRSHSIKSLPHPRDKHLRKSASMANIVTSETRGARTKKAPIVSSKVNIEFSKPRRRGQYDSENSRSSKRSNFRKGTKKVFVASSHRGSKRRNQSSTISSARDSMTLLQVQESPPDFKKMVLSEVIPSEKEDPVLKKILKNKRSKKKKKIVGDKKEVLFSDEVENSQQVSESDNAPQFKKKLSRSSSLFKTNEKAEIKNKRLSKKESIVMEDVSLKDEVESINSQETSKSTKLSQNKGKQPRSSQSVKTNKIKTKNEQNKRLSKKESIIMENIYSQIKEKSDKELKKSRSSGKYFSQTEKKDTKRNKYPERSKNMKGVEEKQTLLITQHSPVDIKEIIDPSTTDKRNLAKKSCKTEQSKTLPRNNLKVEKEAAIISFGTIIHPKSNPFKNSEKKPPLKKENTISKKKADVKDMPLTTSQQKSVKKYPDIKKKAVKEETSSFGSKQKFTKEDLNIKSNDRKSMKFHVNVRKNLSKMKKKFKKEIIHSFETNFFHSMKKSDTEEKSNSREEKSNSRRNRPSSSVSWKTYAKTARKLSDLNLIKLLKKENSKKEKKRRKKGGLKRTKISSTSISTQSGLMEIMDKEDPKFSRNDTVLWSEYETTDFDRLLEIDRNELKPSIVSSLSEMGRKELKPSFTSSQSAQSSNTNKGKMIYKRKKSSKNKIKSKKKIKNIKTFKNESPDESDEAKSDSSLIKIILEHSESTQTKPLQKTQVYNVGTQADHLEIYMSQTNEQERHKSIQFYTDLIHGSNVTFPFPHDPEEVEGEDIYMKSPPETIISNKEQSQPDQDQSVTVSKMVSWFQKLKSQAPIPPTAVSYILKQKGKPTRKSTATTKSVEETKITAEEDSEDMVEEGVDDIPALIEDYKIEDAQTILAQMRLFNAGERDLNKLISTDLTQFVDFSLVEEKLNQDEIPKEKPILEDREEVLALNKNLLKFKADELSMESFSDDDGFEEEEPFNMETKGKEMQNLLARLINNIFETDTKPMQMPTDMVSMISEEPVNESESHGLGVAVDSDDPLQSPPSMEEIWKNTTREEWHKKNKEKTMEPEEEKKKEEAEENLKQSDPESEIVYTFHRTPTDGLSPLARELYEIRDIFEYYIHSNVEPLDWRVMIDRRAEY